MIITTVELWLFSKFCNFIIIIIIIIVNWWHHHVHEYKILYVKNIEKLVNNNISRTRIYYQIACRGSVLTVLHFCRFCWSFRMYTAALSLWISFRPVVTSVSLPVDHILTVIGIYSALFHAHSRFFSLSVATIILPGKLYS